MSPEMFLLLHRTEDGRFHLTPQNFAVYILNLWATSYRGDDYWKSLSLCSCRRWRHTPSYDPRLSFLGDHYKNLWALNRILSFSYHHQSHLRNAVNRFMINILAPGCQTFMIGKKVEVSLRLFNIFERNRVFISLCRSFGTHRANCTLWQNW